MREAKKTLDEEEGGIRGKGYADREGPYPYKENKGGIFKIHDAMM